MSAALPRLVSLVSALAFGMFGAVANAQVTLHLTTTQQGSCNATTDANGLSLVPGSTDLQATGVSLTGSGCGGSNFQANVTAPGTATVGTPINVAWSASTDATICTYGAPSSGVSGWIAGGVACQGAACAGSHSVPVTINTAGTYNFGVTCTNATGYAQSSAVVATGGGGSPPSPANFALTLPASATTGIAFAVSWAVTGATSCSGSAQLNGSSVNLAGWTDSTSATSPRNVTATTAGTYGLSLTCSNGSGSVTSAPATIVVQQGDASCPSVPRTRATVSNILYPPTNPVRSNVDLTLFENIWGHLSPTDETIIWPGRAGATSTIATIGKTQYVASKFHVPASTNPYMGGYYKNVSYGAGPNLDIAISTQCGDFTPAQAGCHKEDVPSTDRIVVNWRMQNPTTYYCVLTPNTDYYVNIQFHDPATTGPGCSGNTCKSTIQHQWSIQSP